MSPERLCSDSGESKGLLGLSGLYEAFRQLSESLRVSESHLGSKEISCQLCLSIKQTDSHVQHYLTFYVSWHLDEDGWCLGRCLLARNSKES